MNKIKIDKERVKEIIRTKWWLMLIELAVFAFIIAFDLCMKDYLFKLVSGKPGMNMTLIENFVDLTYSENTGAGFGSFKNATLPLSIITGIVIVCILTYLVFFHKEKEGLRIPLIFIAAGGIGNLVDRVTLGYVRDFFEFTFMKFAIFNIADAFVTVGAIWLVIYLIYMMASESKKGNRAAEGASDAADNVGAKSAGADNDGGKNEAENAECKISTLDNSDPQNASEIFGKILVGSDLNGDAIEPEKTKLESKHGDKKK